MKELFLLKKLYEAAKNMGQARKHDCPGYDCATCNTTGVFNAVNDLDKYYAPDETPNPFQK